MRPPYKQVHPGILEVGEVMAIGDIIKKNQPDVYRKLMKFKNTKNEKIDYKRMMEDTPVYKRHNGAWRQVKR